ncbi:hypothetical protein EMIHUDRAFT_201152 [Emiliania huxleyi CCMP1516]|uniref:Bromo domain-containing protein n=2 Tax=Emiliania huxleyi TaxID=2903 RepID=A0A0D3KM89_EMIH1|nr:hypothetical protein EMIHUDRAFT_201152 [Emiliania huxleyi CCMP1516]EOD36874.1 hypothetical protein EMIHUDRAFT_201152 [Emiliania huxleyi CCMP1516]|eukprot:XP_005789303.1 hypothetical protein EMIHUDRAFT_201152 [Emiliania huxleyi CCMP1516]
MFKEAALAREVHKMLEAFKRREPCKLYFNRPVSATAGADFMRGYLTVIKQPMDLGTRPADEKHYQFLEDFACDCRQIWKNALVFNEPRGKPEPNKPGSPAYIFDHASKLASDFEAKLAEMHRELEKEAPPCPRLLRARLLLADVRRSPFSEHYRREKDWRKLGDEYVAFLREEMKRPSEPEDLDSITDWLRKVQRQADGEDAGQAAWLAWLAELKRRVVRVCENALAYNQGRQAAGKCAKHLKEAFELRSRVARQLAKESPRALKPLDGREAGSSKRVRVELDELDAETFARARELAEERARKAVEMDLQDELEEYPQ